MSESSSNGRAEPLPDAVTRPSVDPDWWAANWKKFCITAAVFTTFAILSCFGGGLIGSTISTKQTPQYLDSKAMVEASEDVVSVIGTPTTESWIAWATIDTNDRGFARRTILFTLTGPAGAVTVESVAVDEDPRDGVEAYTLQEVRAYLPESAAAEAGQIVTLKP